MVAAANGAAGSRIHHQALNFKLQAPNILNLQLQYLQPVNDFVLSHSECIFFNIFHASELNSRLWTPMKSTRSAC